MKVYTLFLLISSVIFVAQADAAASSSRVLRIRKPVYTAQDYAYLKKTLGQLMQVQAYDEAYDLCYQDNMPENCSALIKVTLGKLCLVNTERGMQRNREWAKWYFEQAIKTTNVNPAEESEAREYLKSLEEELQATDDVPALPRACAKRSQRSFETLERETKETRTVHDHTCPACAKSFDSLRGLRIHQTLKGHKTEDNSQEIFAFESPRFSSSDAEAERVFEGLEFREFTQAEYQRTCLVCNNTFKSIQALRSHQSYKNH